MGAIPFYFSHKTFKKTGQLELMEPNMDIFER